jgi:hypothetical protein
MIVAPRVTVREAGAGTMLRQQGVDIKTAQELLRHANSRITPEIYQQAVGAEKRVAQNLAFRGLLEGSSLQHPRRGYERRCHIHKPLILFGLWRGTTGLEPASSAVTESVFQVFSTTYRLLGTAKIPQNTQ